jgi:pyrroline-5-carboxylate reductase
MNLNSVGFIGGGRVTRIMLRGWQRANALPGRIVVSDPDGEVLAKLKADVPAIDIAPNDNGKAASQALVFVALHPAVLLATLGAVRGVVSSEAVVISLAPKFTLAKIADALGGHAKLARMIPNAPSIIGAGFNPISFAPDLPDDARQAILALLAPLGDCPVVLESKLEAYALLTGMGPTYLWFQLETLRDLGRRFGLSDEDLVPAVKRTVCGAARTLLESGLTPAEVMDLVPVKPLAEDEATIGQAYQTRLPALFARIRP